MRPLKPIASSARLGRLHLLARGDVGVDLLVEVDAHAASSLATAVAANSALRRSRLTSLSYNRMVVSMQTALDFDRVFAALADATRRDIVRRAIAGEEGVAELAGHYTMSFAAVQKHIAVLERAGLVGKERDGRRKVVRTRPEGVLIAQRLLNEYEELWRGRLDRMSDLIDETKEKLQ